MSAHDDSARLSALLARNTTEPFVLPQNGTDSCACRLLLPGFPGAVKLIRRYVFCKLAEHCPFQAFKNFLYRVAGAKIGRGVVIAPGAVLDYLCCDLIEIGDGCVLGMGCMLLAHEFTHVESRIGRVRLGRNVTVGARAVIRSGIGVGDGAIIGMMSLVTRDVTPGSTVVGIPAKRIHDAGNFLSSGQANEK